MEIKTYKLTGKTNNGLVRLIGFNKNTRKLGSTTLMLEIKGDGDILEGYLSGYSVTLNKIHSYEIKFKRK